MHAYYTTKLMHNDYGFSFFLFLSSLVLVCVVSSPYRRQAAPLAIMTPIFKTLVFPRHMGRQIVLPTPFKNVAMVRWYIIIYIKVKNGITIYFQYALLPFQIFAGWGMMNGLYKYPNRFCCRYLLYFLQLNPTYFNDAINDWVYLTRAIVTRGLYTFYPFVEVNLCTMIFGLTYG